MTSASTHDTAAPISAWTRRVRDVVDHITRTRTRAALTLVVGLLVALFAYFSVVEDSGLHAATKAAETKAKAAAREWL